ADQPELDRPGAKSYQPHEGRYDVQPRTDGLARKGWFRRELEPCERKPSCTVLRGKGFVRIWTTRCAMKCHRPIFTTFVILHACQCLAGERSYYSDFLNASASKAPPFRIAANSLVDTNNSLPTVSRKPIPLAPGVIAGVRLGMSMEEVVSLWGKPL